MSYKYQLDKSSKKFQCPNCNKKTFVKYIECDTNLYLEETIGRCDRESKCGYFKAPNGNKPIINHVCNTNVIQQTYHNIDILGLYGSNHKENNFVQYLLKHFVPQDVSQAIRKYNLGTSNYWNGAAIFWQIDELLNVCAGKVMLYDKDNGKRVKQPFTHINWMHCVLQLKDFVLQQCLFGLHNLCDHPKGSTVCIVESEKTAVIMSIIFPTILWLATGSKSNLKEQLLIPLKDYKIIVYPDKTEFNVWNVKIEALKIKGFNITCSNLLEKLDLEEGADLVDFLISIDFKGVA